MRQKDDVEFANLFNRVQTQTHTAKNISILKDRTETTYDSQYPSDALHVYTTNNKVDQYNEQHLQLTSHSIYTILALDMNTEQNTGQFKVQIPDNSNRTGGLR